MKTDVLIIGGGAAGLMAAYELASRGVEVTIANEGNKFGGQFNHQTQFIESNQFSQKLRGFQVTKLLLQKLSSLNVRFLSNYTAVGTYEDNTFGFNNGDEIIPIVAERTLIAVGAAEKPLLFPRWTLPGVLTLGAAQIMINREMVLPGKSAVILGSSDFSFELAEQMQAVGIRVNGIYEKESVLQVKNKVKFADLDVPVFLETQVESVNGSGEVEEVIFTRRNEIWSVKADLICVDGGRKPIIEPFEILGCSIDYQEKLGGWIPFYNENFETSTKSIYLAGNCAGITTQSGVITTAKIAGISMADSLGLIPENDSAEIHHQLWEELKTVETKWDQSVYEARIAHINNFSKE